MMIWGFKVVVMGLLLVSACGSPNLDPEVDSCGLSLSKRKGIKICSFVASPTHNESIELKNYNEDPITLTGYDLWDKNAYENGTGSKALDAITVPAGEKHTVSSLPFGVNDSDETLYLTNDDGDTVDTATN